MKRTLLAGIALGTMMAAAHADTYVVSMKGPAAGNPYWAAFEEGAKAKGKELGVDVNVVSPPSETDVQAQMTDLIALIAHPPEVLARSNEQHARIVKALRKGDAARAVRTLREHSEGTEHILAGLLPRPARLEAPTPA